MKLSRRDIAAGFIFVALIAIFIITVNAVTNAGGEQELNIVRDAVKNAALTCYAAEGAYPQDLEYLRKYYHLAYNEEKYLVHYDAFASNVMPDISVVERGKSAP